MTKVNDVKSIHDFINEHKNEGLMGRDWNKLFIENNYFGVNAGTCISTWGEVLEWCSLNFGIEHYAWAGSTFYFETEQDMIYFSLVWL